MPSRPCWTNLARLALPQLGGPTSQIRNSSETDVEPQEPRQFQVSLPLQPWRLRLFRSALAKADFRLTFGRKPLAQTTSESWLKEAEVGFGSNYIPYFAAYQEVFPGTRKKLPGTRKKLPGHQPKGGSTKKRIRDQVSSWSSSW